MHYADLFTLSVPNYFSIFQTWT